MILLGYLAVLVKHLKGNAAMPQLVVFSGLSAQ